MAFPFSIFFWLLTCLSLQAFDPTAGPVFPRGGQLGTEVNFTFYGERLDGVQEVILYRPGITVSNLKSEENKRIKGTFKIAADAPLGEHPLRIRTTEGVSYLRTFWVTPFPTVPEKTVTSEKKKNGKKDITEFNNTFETPQRIDLNTVVHGIARKEDADYYLFSGKKGQTITAEVFGMRLGRSMFDPYLALIDSERFELATCDDSVLTKRDPFLSVTLPADGDYTLLVRESSYEGSIQANYLLQLSESPRPTSVHPPVGSPGQTLELTFKSPTGETKQSLTLPQTPGITPLFAEKNGLKSPSPNSVLVTKLPIHPEQEPNNGKKSNPSEATSLPALIHGIIAEPKDQDWFTFEAKKGQNLRVQVHARSLRSPLDAIIQVRSVQDNKNLGTSDDDDRNPDPKLDFKVPADGKYFLHIRDHLHRGGPDFTYAIEISERTPTIRAELPYAINNNSQKDRAIVIPRSNHLAIVPNVARQNTGCDVILEHDKLPKGVTTKFEPATRNPAGFPILFSAAKDAPLGSTLSTFTIKDSKSDLRGPFEEHIHHVEVNNAGPFCSTLNRRLTVAVIEEAPFHLTIETPAVPLVRSGTMNLVVRANRQKDFTKPIKLKIPWRPPGVGAPPEVTIPEGKNEVIIPINANGEAVLRKWPLCVTGEAATGRGNVRVSSPFTSLEVAEPYLNGSIDLATTSQGQNVTLVCELENLKPFPGEAELTLQGLPHNVSAKPIKIKSTDKSIKIPIKVSPEVRPSKNKNIFAQVKIMQGKHPIPHQIAQGTTLVITPKASKTKKTTNK